MSYEAFWLRDTSSGDAVRFQPSTPTVGARNSIASRKFLAEMLRSCAPVPRNDSQKFRFCNLPTLSLSTPCHNVVRKASFDRRLHCSHTLPSSSVNTFQGRLYRGGWVALKGTQNTAFWVLAGDFPTLKEAVESLGPLSVEGDVRLFVPDESNTRNVRWGVHVVAEPPTPPAISFGGSATEATSPAYGVDLDRMSLGGVIQTPTGLIGSRPASQILLRRLSFSQPSGGPEEMTQDEASTQDKASFPVSIDAYTMAILLDAVDEARRPGLSEQILRAATGTIDVRPENSAAVGSLAQDRWALEHNRRQQSLDTEKQITDELLASLQRWRRISHSAVPLLIVTTAFAMIGVCAAVLLVGSGRITGSELALITFGLAVFAASPATLLLLERPLKGVDSFNSPTAPRKPPVPTLGAESKTERPTADVDTN